MQAGQTNINFRKANGNSYANDTLILGYKIQLSNTNSTKIKVLRCDLCTQLTGSYPTSFNWTGWHDRCVCYKTPILMEREYLTKCNRLIAQGTDTPEAVQSLRLEAGLITELPDNFKDWVLMNVRSEEKFEIAPNWIIDNFENFNELKQSL